MELDAREYMATHKVEATKPLTKEQTATKQAALMQVETDKDKNIDDMTSEMSDDEMVESKHQ